jgi:hypothetical protein
MLLGVAEHSNGDALRRPGIGLHTECALLGYNAGKKYILADMPGILIQVSDNVVLRDKTSLFHFTMS